jgi:hypothetical protein
MKLAISLSWWRRPEYSKRTLDALKSCPGFYDCPVYLSLDGHGEQKDLANYAGQAIHNLTRLTLHGPNIGANANIRAAVGSAFQDGADFVVHVEDDILVSPDSIRLMRWMAEKFEADKSVLTCALWRPGDAESMGLYDRVCTPDEHLSVTRDRRFTCWGWGTWKDRWSEIDAKWPTGGDFGESWDHAIHFRIRGDRVQISPLVSRAQNIGKDLGTHRGDMILPHWIGDVPIMGEYREV